jgi:hypothetical protein
MQPFDIKMTTEERRKIKDRKLTIKQEQSSKE